MITPDAPKSVYDLKQALAAVSDEKSIGGAHGGATNNALTAEDMQRAYELVGTAIPTAFHKEDES